MWERTQPQRGAPSGKLFLNCKRIKKKLLKLAKSLKHAFEIVHF